MLTPKQMRILDRTIADLGRVDLAELLARIRSVRHAQFREHLREVMSRVREARARRRARIREIQTEVWESRQEWQRQLRQLQRLKWDHEQGNRHRPRYHQ